MTIVSPNGLLEEGNELELFQRHMVVDLSDVPAPVEVIAARIPELWLTRFRPVKVRHPDIWHDGRWVE